MSKGEMKDGRVSIAELRWNYGDKDARITGQRLLEVMQTIGGDIKY